MDVLPGRDLGALCGNTGGGWLSYQLQPFLHWWWLLQNRYKKTVSSHLENNFQVNTTNRNT